MEEREFGKRSARLAPEQEPAEQEPKGEDPRQPAREDREVKEARGDAPAHEAKPKNGPKAKNGPKRKAPAPHDPADYVCPVCETSERMMLEHHALDTERQKIAAEGGLKAPLDLRQQLAALDVVVMKRRDCTAAAHQPPEKMVQAWQEHLAEQPRPPEEGKGPPSPEGTEPEEENDEDAE